MATAGNIVKFNLIVYAPLDFTAIPNQPHDFPTGEYQKCLPKFAGNNAISVDDHLTNFLKFVDDLELGYENVVMKTFVQTLEGDTRMWYKFVHTASIDGWDTLDANSQKNGATNKTILS
jgi:hypothetical protein